MSKIILMVTGSLVLGGVLSPKAFSVVPSPISMDVSAPLNQEGVAGSTSSKIVGQVADKLADDERRLESVLRDLKEDQKALKKTDSTEGQDGHRLH